MDCFYGEVIDFEIQTIIPALKNQFKEEEHTDFHLFLNKKIKLLIDKKHLIEKLAENNQLDEKTYMKELQNCLKKNKECL